MQKCTEYRYVHVQNIQIKVFIIIFKDRNKSRFSLTMIINV